MFWCLESLIYISFVSFSNFFCGLGQLYFMLQKCFHVYLIYFHIIDESGLISIHQQIEVVMKLREVK